MRWSRTTGNAQDPSCRAAGNFLADLSKESDQQRDTTRSVVRATWVAKEDATISARESEAKLAELEVDLILGREEGTKDLLPERIRTHEHCQSVANATKDLEEQSVFFEMLDECTEMAQTIGGAPTLCPECTSNIPLRDLPNSKATDPTSTLLLCLSCSHRTQ